FLDSLLAQRNRTATATSQLRWCINEQRVERECKPPHSIPRSRDLCNVGCDVGTVNAPHSVGVCCLVPRVPGGLRTRNGRGARCSRRRRRIPQPVAIPCRREIG